MVEILKQPAFKPMNVIDQVLVLFAGTNGYLDKVPVKNVAAWQDQFLRYMHEQKKAVWDQLAKDKSTKGMEATIKAAIEAFQPLFKT
jgi:F-type H+-transporting ATPase subunit alpha